MSVLTMTTLESLKAHVGLTSTTAHDSQLVELGGAAQSVVQRFTGRNMVFGTFSSVRDIGFNTNAIYLKHYPVGTVVALTNDGSLIQNSDLLFYDDIGRIARKDAQVFAIGGQKVEITYSGGFEIIPGDLQFAVNEIVNYWFHNISRSGLQAERIGDYSYAAFDPRLTDGISPIALPILQSLARVDVAVVVM